MQEYRYLGKEGVRDWLLRLVKDAQSFYREPVWLTRPYECEGNGFVYDVFQWCDNLDGCYLMDSANGDNNPTVVAIDTLTPSMLLSLYKDILRKDIDDFLYETQNSEQIESNLLSAFLGEMAYFFKRAPEKVAIQYIYERVQLLLRSFAWKRTEERLCGCFKEKGTRLPYLLETLSDNGQTAFKAFAFDEIRIVGYLDTSDAYTVQPYLNGVPLDATLTVSALTISVSSDREMALTTDALFRLEECLMES